MGMEQYLLGMWKHFTIKRAWTEKVLADAEKQKQEGIQGNWQMESPFKEELELVKRSSDLSCNAYLMRRAYHAGKSGNWEGHEEAHQKKLLRRIIAPVSGVGGATSSYVCPHCRCLAGGARRWQKREEEAVQLQGSNQVSPFLFCCGPHVCAFSGHHDGW